MGIPAGSYAVPKHTPSTRFAVKLELDKVSVEVVRSTAQSYPKSPVDRWSPHSNMEELGRREIGPKICSVVVSGLHTRDVWLWLNASTA